MGRTGPIVVSLLLSLALAGAATAASRPGAMQAPRTVHAGGRVFADGGLTLDEAVARAEKRHDARAVRAEEKNQDGRTVYRIRLLSADGRVFEVRIDARTGAEL